MSIELGDYNTVPERITEFRAKYPDGSLQPANLAEPYRIEKIGERHYIVVVAAAYRSPTDARPGIGMAYEQWPGKTNFTRESELQNAETSAWGRAIVAALAADTKKGIATKEDVENRRAEQEERDANPLTIELFAMILDATDQDQLKSAWQSVQSALKLGEINEREAAQLNAHVKRRKAELESHDSTGDSDRSGSGAQPSSAGAGPDGEGAEERGSGSNDEAGPLRPGVQPTVHQRDGVGGPAQASRDDRGARAEVGGRRE